MGQTLVHYNVEDGIAVLEVDNPPVNALSPGVPEGIRAGIAAANADPGVVAIVLKGSGRGFIAGADIRYFGKGAARPVPGERFNDRLEDSAKPIVAAIHGFALGGGLETALGCHYRIATASAKVGLPEVLIGVLPGGAGTQRLPRLIGPKAALEMIVSGRHVPAEEARQLGIIDAVVPDNEDLTKAAIRFAKSIADKRPLPIASRNDERLAEARQHPAMFDEARETARRKMKGQPAPLSCIACVEAAVTLPYLEGLKREAELFRELEYSPEAKALQYAFFSERAAKKAAPLPAGEKLPAVKSAGVVGAGTMGIGIAMSFADHGYPVKLIEKSRDVVEGAMRRIGDLYAASVKRGGVSEAEARARIALIKPIDDFSDLAGCDVIIEAVFEDLAVKKDIFATLDQIAKPGALLLSNTSSIDIDAIASAVSRPESVAGAHFFSPANVMKLLEIVQGQKSSPMTMAAAMALAPAIGKVPVWAGNTDGFVANRSRGALGIEAAILVEEGANPADVDRVLTQFGMPMGTFATADLAGIDIGAAIRKRRMAENPNTRPNPVADRLVSLGRLGQKAGAGFYRYEKGDRTPRHDPEVEAIIQGVRKSLGITPRSFTDEELLHRQLLASVNEACKILEEKKARRASDVDVMWLYGFGFPRYRGGLMFWADTIGAKRIHEQIDAWHRTLGPRWKPSGLLADVAGRDGLLREVIAIA